jgi:talin
MIFDLKEHKKHIGLSELDGKVKYTQLCRSLRTYGVTFFLVKVIGLERKFSK